MVQLSAHDVLPLKTFRRTLDVQEQRAAALWEAVTGAVDILIARSNPAAMPSSSMICRVLRRTRCHAQARRREVDIKTLTAHLSGVGYTQMDLVEMPGDQFTRPAANSRRVLARGGPPNARQEVFGDEIQTIPKFDPGDAAIAERSRRDAASATHRRRRSPNACWPR